MARAARLKVYRTSAGFEDAYVAAPSQAAALKAWGARGDLFALGEATVVSDAELTAEPLARPGEVVRRCSRKSARLSRRAEGAQTGAGTRQTRTGKAVRPRENGSARHVGSASDPSSLRVSDDAPGGVLRQRMALSASTSVQQAAVSGEKHGAHRRLFDPHASKRPLTTT